MNGGTLKFTPGNDPASSLANDIEFQTGGTNFLSNGSLTGANRGFAISGALTGGGGFTTVAPVSIMALLNITGNSTMTGTVNAAQNTMFVASNSSRDALAATNLNLGGGNVIFSGSAANVGAIADFSRAINVASNSSLGTGAGFTFTQTGALTGTGTLSINTAQAGNFTNAGLSAQILNPGATSVVVLNGDVSGFSGGLTVNQGTFRIGSAATLPGQLGLLTLATGTTFDLNNRDVTVRGLDGATSTPVVQGNASGSAKTLTINTTGTDRSFAGTIVNGTATALNLTKIGTNTQTLTGANTYTGTTTVNGGTLATVTGANTTPRIQGGGALVLGGGTLFVTGSTTAATDVTQTFSGTTLNPGFSVVRSNQGVGGGQSNIALGAITRNPGAQVAFTLPTSGTITTETANTATSILAGWANIANDWATSAGSPGTPGAITPYVGYTASTNASTYGVSNTGDITANAAITGTAPTGTINSLRFNVAGASTLTIGASDTLTIGSGGILATSNITGTTLITGGTIQGTAATGLNLRAMASQEFKITSVIADNGGATALSVASSNFTTITGTTINTYSGQTYLNSGWLRLGGGSGVIGSNANLGDQTVGAALNINGGALFYDGNFALDNAGANKRNVVIGSAGAIFRPVPTASTDSLTISGVISGSDLGILTLGGTNTASGNLTLTGINTYNGGTTISGTVVNAASTAVSPTLILGNNNAIGTGALTFAGAGATTNVLGLRSLDATNLTLANRIGDISGSGVTLKFGSSTTGNLTFTNTTSASLGAGANRTFQVDNAQTSFANGFTNTSAVIKTGTGTLLFGGASTYTGVTTVNAGTLLVTGSISGSATTVNTTGTLGGTGILQAVTINGGGTLSPGTSIGTLNTGALSMADTSTLSIELGSITGDQVKITGSATLAGTITLGLTLTADPTDNTAFTLFNGTATLNGYAGGARFAYLGNALDEGEAFTATTGLFTQEFTISYTADSGNDVVLTAVPEPGSAALLLGGLAMLASRRRRS